MLTQEEFKITPTEININKDLVKNESVVKLYANGFQCGVTLGDASIVLKQDDVPVALIHLSQSSIKSLASQINSVLKTFTDQVKIEVNDFDELIEKLKTSKPNEL